jgi:hypothetical protein
MKVAPNSRLKELDRGLGDADSKIGGSVMRDPFRDSIARQRREFQLGRGVDQHTVRFRASRGSQNQEEITGGLSDVTIENLSRVLLETTYVTDDDDSAH